MRDFLTLLISKFTVLILSIFVVFAQAKGLGSEQRGLLAMILLFPQLLVSITDGGMRQAVSFLLGKKLEDEKNILGSVRLFSFISVLIWGAGLLIIQYSYLDGKVDNHIIYLSVLILPLIVFVNSYRGVFIGKGHINHFSRTLLIPRVAYFLMIIVLLLIDRLTLETAFFSFVIFHFITFFLSRALCRKGKVFFRVNAASKGTLTKIFKLGSLYAIALFFIDLNYKAGILIVSNLSSAFDVGNYVVSTQLVEFIWQIQAALSIVIFSKSVNKKKYDVVWLEEIKRISRVQFFFGGVFSIIISGMLYFLSSTLLGAEYSKVPDLFILLLPGIVFMNTFKLINVDFSGRGKPMISIYFMPLVLVFNCLFSYVLFPFYGIYGIAGSVSISFVVATLIITVLYERSYSNDFSILNYFIIEKTDLFLMLKILNKVWLRNK